MNRVTVLFCVYLHNPSLPWPSYTSQSLHLVPPPPPPSLLGSYQCCVLLLCHSFFSILSACYINYTCVTEGKSSSMHLHHHRMNLIMTLDTQFVRIISSLYHILCHFYAHPLVIPRPITPTPPHPWSWDLVLIFCWDGRFQGSGFGSRAQKQRFTLLFL